MPMSSRHFPACFANGFNISGFLVKVLDPLGLELGFEKGDKYGSICFFFLHMDIQLDQHHLLKMLSCFHYMVFASLSKMAYL